MNISPYIATLLYRYECVIIPGFGAFLTHPIPARKEGDPPQFYPPAKALSFNALLQANDGLLAGYIAQKENLSYEIALQNLRDEVSRLKRVLDQEKQLIFAGIGSLTLNQQGVLSFEPDTSQNYLKQAFGLAPVYAPQGQATPSATPAVKTLPQPTASFPYARYAAVGLLAIGLAVFGRMYYLNQQIEQHNFAERQKAIKQVESQIQQATFVVTEPLPAITFSVKKPAGHYHLVAGAFRIEDNAHSQIATLQEKGYPARLLGVSKYGLYQVVYGSYADKETALQALRKIQTSENPDAWLLVQETE